MKKIILTAILAISVMASARSVAPPTFYAVGKSNTEGFKFADKTIEVDLASGKQVNTLVSPTSLHYALSIAINGAGDAATLNS